MVGEIRDLETAQIAVQAALTGHLVLSTLHTNSAAATITRLRDMGVEDYLLTAVLRGVLAQRLVRRLCPDCRRAESAPAELVARLRPRPPGRRDDAVSSGAPSAARPAAAAGYRGRMAIAEFLPPDAAIDAAHLRPRRPGRDRARRRRRRHGDDVRGRPRRGAGRGDHARGARAQRAGRSADARVPLCRDRTAAAWRAACMQAPDADHVVARLRRAGNIPVSATPASRGSALAQLLQTDIGRGRALSRQGLTELHCASSPRCWAPARTLIARCASWSRPRPDARARRVRPGARCGARRRPALATAMAAEPRSFPRLLIGLVRAGEAGGTLAPTLERLAELLERERSLAATVPSAMIYPALLLVTAAGSVTLLLTQVLPQFVPLFEQNGVAAARLDAVPDRCRRPSCLPTACMRWRWRCCWCWPGGRRCVGPGRGASADACCCACRSSAACCARCWPHGSPGRSARLLLNGVPLIAALGIVRDTVGNLAGSRRSTRASASVRDGGGLAAPLAPARVFPLAHHLTCCGSARRPRSSARRRCGRRKSTKSGPGWACSGWWRCWCR